MVTKLRSLIGTSSKNLHFASLAAFIGTWLALSMAGAFSEVNFWFMVGFFVMGASFVVGLVTRRQ
jgi:hypothetical protein